MEGGFGECDSSGVNSCASMSGSSSDDGDEERMTTGETVCEGSSCAFAGCLNGFEPRGLGWCLCGHMRRRPGRNVVGGTGFEKFNVTGDATLVLLIGKSLASLEEHNAACDSNVTGLNVSFLADSLYAFLNFMSLVARFPNIVLLIGFVLFHE